MNIKKVTISIPLDDFEEWQQYVKLYGSFSHFIREAVSDFIKTQDPTKRVGLLDIILEHKHQYNEIQEQLASLKEFMLQKQKLDTMIKLKNRCLKYLRKFEQASDAELMEWLEINEGEFLDLTSILMKQNLIDLFQIKNQSYWALKKQ